jgi:hypothetical protein
MTARSLSIAALLGGVAPLACAPPSDDTGPASTDPDGPGSTEVPALPAPTAACDLDAFEPQRLLLTTTDFSTGALTVLDLATDTVDVDVAVSSTDAVPYYLDGRVVVVHRFGHDRLDVLSAEDWTLQAQVSLPPRSDAPATNPHTAVAGPDGHLWVTAFGEPRLIEVDPAAPPAEAVVGDLDLSPVADADGNPDASVAVACGDRMYVATQRVDGNFRPRGEDTLVAIDLPSRQLVDADPERDGVQGLATLGTWTRQLRRDPGDPTGHTLLGLSTGIERIDLDAGEVTWAVPASRFVAVGLDDFLQPQAFDVDAAGDTAYLAAYDADFSQVRLYEVGLDGNDPELPQAFAQGFDSVERTLEVVGDSLWYASARADAPGLWRFDLSLHPPVDDGPPRATGLPPYSMVPLP